MSDAYGATTTTPLSTAGLFLWDKYHAGDFGAFETSLQSGACTSSDVFNWGDAFGPGSGWKTLTATEWEYLRANSMTSATVNGVQGCILRPDGYPAADVRSSYGPLTNPTWSEAEAAGLVFLPAAGYVNSAQVSSDDICAYWTANASSSGEAKYYVYWSTNVWNTVGSMSRAQGAAVRLVQKFFKPHEYVDLGLSVEWATCNLGASKPEEYGDYYAWGETAGYNEKMVGDGANSGVSYSPGTVKTNYSWDYYKWGSGENKLGKYVDKTGYGMTPDNKTVLDLEDDAARANWGGDWRMPTSDEWQELYDNTTWTWTTENGVAGRKFTSTKEGYTDRYIFLPAAGYRDGTNYYHAESGYYWLSSLYSSDPRDAYGMGFDSGGVGQQNYYFRFRGLTVRPVR